MSDDGSIGGGGLLVTEVERRYPRFRLGPVSFHLPPGRALGLLGSNGAGKTTLLAGLAGQARLQSGAVAWNGQRIVRGEWRYRHQVSYVRDVPAFYGELTVRQTIAFVERLHPSWRSERATQLLDAFDLDPGKRVQALSRGMRAKLGLLLAACHDVRLLLLDEVTAGVDADTRDEIQRFLRRLVAEGVALVVSSHIFEDIEHVSDDVLILRRGVPVFSGVLSAIQHLMVAVLPSPAPQAFAGSSSIVGTWNVAGETTLLMATPIEPALEAALDTSRAIRRAATVRDLYFAYRDRT
jgi:ABC-2 type transport system ATP-binding protein